MNKKYVSDQNLEEYIVNFLRDKAKSKKFNFEGFSFKAIMDEMQKKYNLGEERLNKILNKLKKDEIITVRSRNFDIYVPKEFEKNFIDLTSKMDPASMVMSILFIGYLALSIILNISGKGFTIRIGHPDDVLAFILIISFSIGLGVIIKRIWHILYKNIKILREMIDFFGGRKVWGYAIFLAFIFLIFYVLLAMILKYEINPYYSVGIFISVFIAVLIYGGKKKHP